MHEELKPYRNYEVAETLEELFNWRCKLEDATAQLRNIRVELDEEIIRRMKEQNVPSFDVAYGGETAKVRYGKEKKTKVDTRTMKKFLLEGKGDSREMAAAALSGGQSAWKATQVQLMADTLGLPTLIETNFGEKVIVKLDQKEKLKKLGIIE